MTDIMDWTQIIITGLTVLFGGSGLVALVTLQDRKYAAMLENMKQMIASNAATNDEWKEIAEERMNRAEELKGDLDRKDVKIEKLYSEIARLRNSLDHLRTANAVNALMKCMKTKCGERQPPSVRGWNSLK